ncbi:cryptochrome/photolyase family protein [Xanthobacter sediminis]
MMTRSPALIWFRDDLRLSDNPALDAAARSGRPLAALFVLDEDAPGLRALGGAARWWLAGALRALAAELGQHGLTLVLRRGPATRIVSQVAAELGAALVVFNDRPGAAEARVDAAVAARLRQEERQVERFCGHLLHAPETVRSSTGRLPRTFSAFHRAALRLPPPAAPLGAPSRLHAAAKDIESDALEAWGLEPEHPDWAAGLRLAWRPGERAARARLSAFIAEGLAGYAEGRDFPARPHVSRLSPHLRFGEISPRQILAAVGHAEADGAVPAGDGEKFRAELYWREFGHHLLAEMPDLAGRNVQGAFDAFPWRECPGEMKAWQRGATGYPIVDAGMRELWQTGWMHNRVRMVAASFLAKHLLIDWRLGEAWFWDTLVDADPASNPANWQWVAGTGLDAAPYFRIFNPVLQGERFDPDGAYVRRFVPELARLPASVIHRPWTAGPALLRAAGVTLGATYPHPVVDLAGARERALLALKSTQ